MEIYSTTTQTMAEPVFLLRNDTYSTFSMGETQSLVGPSTTKNGASYNGRISFTGICMWLLLFVGRVVLSPVDSMCAEVISMEMHQ